MDRPIPITNAGHADLVEGPDGSWWAIFLASRPYGRTERDDLYNTGRETFLLPVTWRDGWPVILPAGKPIPYIAPAPKFVPRSRARRRSAATSAGAMISASACSIPRGSTSECRAPTGPTFAQRRVHSRFTRSPEPLSTLKNPSFIGRRQQHLAFEASTKMTMPSATGISAGLAVFQSEQHWYFIGARRTHDGAEIFLERTERRRAADDREGAAPSKTAEGLAELRT